MDLRRRQKRVSWLLISVRTWHRGQLPRTIFQGLRYPSLQDCVSTGVEPLLLWDQSDPISVCCESAFSCIQNEECFRHGCYRDWWAQQCSLPPPYSHDQLPEILAATNVYLHPYNNRAWLSIHTLNRKPRIQSGFKTSTASQPLSSINLRDCSELSKISEGCGVLGKFQE